MRPLLVVVGLLLAPVLTSAQVTVERAVDQARVADDDRTVDSPSLAVRSLWPRFSSEPSEAGVSVSRWPAGTAAGGC